MTRIAIICVALAMSSAAHADECIDIAVAKQSVSEVNGKWIDMTQSQVDFMKGVFATAPTTPDRLPYSDKAAILTRRNVSTVVFIDGDLACDPVELSPPGFKKLMDIGAGEISHAPKQEGGL